MLLQSRPQRTPEGLQGIKAPPETDQQTTGQRVHKHTEKLWNYYFQGLYRYRKIIEFSDITLILQGLQQDAGDLL